MKYFFLLIFFPVSSVYIYAQMHTDTVYVEYKDDSTYNKIEKKYILLDSKTGTKFILDTAQTGITAVNARGIKLWHVKPDIHPYLFLNPVIIKFYFAKNTVTSNKIEICIVYNNNAVGFLNKQNGKFTFAGQD